MGFSFDPTNTTNINNVANINTFDAGTSAVIVNSASGVITPATVTAVISGGPTINTIYRQYVLDGSLSTSDPGK